MIIKIHWVGVLFLCTLFCGTAIADQGKVSMLVNPCAACHGDAGNSVGPAIPNLAGVSPNYFMGAMLAYKYDDEDELEEVIENDEDFIDVEAFPRFSTIMARLAKGYTEEEIKLMAEYFSSQTPKRPTQEFDKDMAAAGKKLHDKHCDKCHEDEGRFAEDDTGVLAGQWKPFFLYTMSDYVDGHRAMPKKMKKQLNEITEGIGQEGIEQLAAYYASITD